MLRRSFLRASMASFAGSLFLPLLLEESCRVLPAGVDSLTKPQPYKRPPEISGGSLAVAYSSGEIWAGSATSLATLNGSSPLPVIRIRKGEALNAVFLNQLGEASNIHWHGLTVPSEMDGHPLYQIGAGQSYNYTFPILDRAATYWYHSHPDGLTAKQVYLGFAGALIVDDPFSASYGLPSGSYDLPMLIQDRRKDPAGTIAYLPDHEDLVTGYLGDALTVNSSANTTLSIDRSLYRLRLINSCNARVLRIGFKDARTFWLIAGDGGLLEQPVQVTELWLSPGERAEVLFDASKEVLGSEITLYSLAFDFNSSHQGQIYKQGVELPIIVLKIERSDTGGASIPATFGMVERLLAQDAVRTQQFVLTMDHSRDHGMHMINGLVFDKARDDIKIKLGDVEIWEFQNTGDAFHSMHVHGTHFQVLERLYAGPKTAIDLGWKDTVLVYPNETVRVLIRFDGYRGRYLIHCHTLEHEDDGMMLNIIVT